MVHGGAVVTVSDDGNVVACGTVNGKLVVFEGTSGQPKIFDKPDGSVNDIAISGDGNTIVLATSFGGLEIYDKNGNLKYQYDPEGSDTVESVNISTNGKIIGCIVGGKFYLYQL